MDESRASLEDQEEYDMMINLRSKSEKQGYDYYNKYAKGKGFSIRKDYIRRHCLSKEVFHRRYTCSRQGYRKDMYMDPNKRSRQPRAFTRCGCDAQLEIKLDKERGDWYVLEFVSKHSHPMCKPDEVAFLRSLRRLTEAQKANVMGLKDVGLQQHQVMDVMERDHGGYEATGFTSRDLYNFFVRQRKKRIQEGDAEHVIKLFWTDAQSRIDYDAFGEVVVFDSTYRVNKYNLPFIPFVGVNHHGSTIIFACAIVSDEKEAELDAKASQSLPFTDNDASPIEKDAACVFTPRAFKKVKMEIYKVMDWEFIDIIDEDICVRYVLSLKQTEKIIIVKCLYEEASLVSVVCPCRKMECESIPCEHIFSVIHFLNLERIPECCIVPRWTLRAKYAFPSDRYGEVYTWSEQMERYRQLHTFGSEAFFKCSMSEERTLKVMKFLQSLIHEDETSASIDMESQYGHVIGQSSRSNIGYTDHVHDPIEVIPKGAPTRRMRGFLEKRERKCGYCRVRSHTIRTCSIYLRKVAQDV
uniref:SWIM-type domain-containing protein n=1 Tax=Oryza brachyantha TaxID=4533 RepID=J3NAK1_ORYBR